jgi:hypothetical protein
MSKSGIVTRHRVGEHGARPKNTKEMRMEYILMIHTDENGWAKMTPAQQQEARRPTTRIPRRCGRPAC